MRIRKRLQSRLPPPDSVFLPSSLLGGASATGESLSLRADENVATTKHVQERETGSSGLSLCNGEDVRADPDHECIPGGFSVLSSHPPPQASEIDGRDLSPHSLSRYFNEAVKREVNGDTPPKRLSAGGSSQPKTKRGGNGRLRDRKIVKAEECQEDDDEDEEKPDNGKKAGAAKKRRRPAVLMEGSRCSRVNGRGWRCSQQTLVGYSLCEHHLGKSRLRSVNSVKCNGRMKKEEFQSSEEDSEWEEEKTTNEKRKHRRKIGKVKARSISSLLHQTQASVLVPAPSSSSGDVRLALIVEDNL